MSPEVSLAKASTVKPVRIEHLRSKLLSSKRLRFQQFGGSLIIAIVMIVVFSLLAAAMVRITNSNSNKLSLQALGQRAYHAAETGNQWALQQLLPMTAPTLTCKYLMAQTPPNISATSGLMGCKVVNSQCHEHSAAEQVVFTLTATGHCQVGELSSQRTLQMLATITTSDNIDGSSQAKNTSDAKKVSSATIISILEIDG